MPEAPEIRQYSDDLNDFFEDHKLTEIKILAGRYKRHEVPDHLNELNKLLPQKIKDIKTKGKFIYVAVNENGKMIARKKIITVGEFYGDNMEVISGLVMGDVIVTTGYQNLFDGQFITTVAK